MTSTGTDRTTSSAPARAVALGVSLLFAALALLRLLPAWSMGAFPFVLAARELSPAIALLALLWIPVARWLLAPGVRRTAVMLVLLGATLVAVWPLAQVGPLAARISAQMGAASALTRPALLASLPDGAGLRGELVRYTAGDGFPLAMRVYRDTTRRGAPRPIVVVLYGGAWRGGDPSQGARTSRALASHGYVVAAIDYRHAPRFAFPAQLEDVRRSLALVRDSAASWNADPARMALLGRSAGGHLAELSAFAPGDAPVQAVVGLYAPWDLVEGYRDLPSPDPIGVRTMIRNFMAGTPAEQPARYRDASPASYVRPGLPPTLLLFGSQDHLVKPEFNRTAAAALRAAHDRVVEVEVPWGEHAFDLVPGGIGERLTYASVVAFLDRELGEARAVSRHPR
jgi:acetyl esterase/lipase